VKRQFTNGTMSALWGVQFSDLELPAGTPLSAWLPAQVYFPPIATDSAVVFEGNANNGGFALDDVRLAAVGGGGCETRPLYKSNLAARADNPFQFAGLRGTDTQYKINFNIETGHRTIGLMDRRAKVLMDTLDSNQAEQDELDMDLV
jgi:hypothetical protein